MSKTPHPFVHLHNHSEYSLLDGAARLSDGKGKPSEFIQTMAKMGYPALALTDHGNLFGAMEFYRSCKAVGIKPIVGMEAYVSPTTRFDKDQRLGEATSHMTIIAQNREGYENLIKLSSMAYLEGFHYKPRIDREILARHSKGLIGFSGCLKGEIPSALRLGRDEDALRILGEFKAIFGDDNFYIEMMDHGLEAQHAVNPKLVELGKKTNTKLVATNDCHYFRQVDHLAHDVVLCIGTGKKLTDEKRLKYGAPEFYYKSPEDMFQRFSELPQALSSTWEIAQSCELKLDFDQLLLPRYEVPVGQTPESYLKKLCVEGLTKRKGQINDRYKDRLEMELGVINKMGFAPYFLIVWDFIKFAREHGIPVGPGRGSGAGSVVAYSLAITSIDPIENGLLFERFLNPDRRSMPDLDIDFSDDGRDRVIQYVRQKYGENCVAQIITFGSMLARGVVRDVGRVLEMPLPEVDKIAGYIPRELGITIDAAMQSVPELRQLYNSNADVKRLIDMAKQIEGLKRHSGVHAAGTVISPGDITAYVPLSKNNKDIVTTQFDGETLSRMGLLKVDFLGLRTLTVIRDAVSLIHERHDSKFDIETIPVNDKTTYELLARADASGIFQLESSGMRDLLRKLKPNNLSDITALISLYRPGPMGSGMLEEFVQRKSDPSKIKYDHPSIKSLLEETYGIIVYQEQVMQIAQVMAGFTPGEADGLRKAMGKKIKEELEKQRDHFIEGALKKNIPKPTATTVYDLMVHFGGYGFNKSHASAYGLISYQTAYLKANFPVEYMAALCTNEIGRSSLASKEQESKLVGYLSDCKDMGIDVLPPDAQSSVDVFTVVTPIKAERPQIRFGLTAIKNVGTGAVESITLARKSGPFESIHDFCSRVDTRLVNKRVVESLIKAGAFDSLYSGPSRLGRPRLLDQVDEALDAGSKVQDDRNFAQESLFGALDIKSLSKKPKPVATSAAEWTEIILLAAEKDVLGLYFSGHPLSRYKSEMTCCTTSTLGRLPESGIVRVAGHVLSVRRMTTKRGNLMARFVMEDLEGEIEVTVFPKMLTPEINEMLTPLTMLVVKGNVETREAGQAEGGTRGLLAEEIISFKVARDRFVRHMTVTMSRSSSEDATFNQLKEIFGKYPGPCRVTLRLRSEGQDDVLLETRVGVKPGDALIEELEKVLGADCCTFVRHSRESGNPVRNRPLAMVDSR